MTSDMQSSAPGRTAAPTDDTATHPAGERRNTGLTSSQARLLLEQWGPNELTPPRRRPPWRIVVGQLGDTIVIVLLVAAVLTALIGDLTDMAVILIVVAINTGIGVFQEMRSTRAISALTRLTAPVARVRRDGGTRVVSASELVPGDVIIVEAGDIVPADARLIEAHGLQAEEAVLTGESMPADKSAAAAESAPVEPSITPSDAIFAASVITRGRGLAVVTSTGARTTFGGISRAVNEAETPKTPLQRRLTVLGRQLSGAAVVLCGLVLVLGLVRGLSLQLMVVTAISLAVAAIPESLPAVVAVSLALGARRMADRHAVIRHLAAVETLGSVTLIATDKTGTLTGGQMRVTHLWTPDDGLDLTGDSPPDTLGTSIRTLVEALTLCNDAKPQLDDAPGTDPPAGDPTEIALVRLAEHLGIDAAQVRATTPRIDEEPFDTQLARMTTVHGMSDGRFLVVCKGSPESILALVGTDDPHIIDATERRVSELSRAGNRVLAVASSVLEEPLRLSEGDPLPDTLRLRGLVAMSNSLREHVIDAVEACRRAGIRPVMITGDHAETAVSIGRRLAFLTSTDGSVAGADIDGLSTTELHTATVFSRTLPQQKLTLIQRWQAAGHVVAMTGDGVNDAPALRAADIGVAMGGSGTAVAKEAADLVLTDDDFGTIVAAIREGRRIYANIRRFVTYGIAGGSAEIIVMLAGPFLGMPVPLIPAQILWVNLLTHGLPGVAFGLEEPDATAMRRPPRPPTETVLGGGLWRRVVMLSALISVLTIGTGIWAERTDRPWQSMVFVVIVMLQLASAMTMRSDVIPIWRMSLRSNPSLIASVIANLALLLLVVYLPIARTLFATEPIAAGDLGILALVACVPIAAIEIAKLLGRRSRARDSA